jgi:hypothetical protein
MGIYFDFDFEEGKEVERWVPCFLCNQRKVLFVEYHIKSGPIYTLYDDARKLWSGKEITVGSGSYLVCEDCFSGYRSEEEVVAEILRRRKEEKTSEKISEIKHLEAEIEEAKKEIMELVERLAKLYQHLEKAKEEEIG